VIATKDMMRFGSSTLPEYLTNVMLHESNGFVASYRDIDETYEETMAATEAVLKITVCRFDVDDALFGISMYMFGEGSPIFDTQSLLAHSPSSSSSSPAAQS